jgi:hypothetical protein
VGHHSWAEGVVKRLRLEHSSYFFSEIWAKVHFPNGHLAAIKSDQAKTRGSVRNF